MKNNDGELKSIIEALRVSKSVLITSHVSPDGDAIGSMLALYFFALSLGVPTIKCVNSDPIPEKYAWLPGASEVVMPSEVTERYETVVVLDVSELERTGDVEDLIDPDSKIIIIDHHISATPKGHLIFHDPTFGATGEIVAEIFRVSGIDMNYEASVCAYVAQITDTGGFRFSNTNPRSHMIASRLLESDLDIADISERMFDLMPCRKFSLLNIFTSRVEFLLDGRISHAYLTQEDLETSGALYEDIDGLINFARNVEGVEVAILFKATGDTTTRISFRSAKTFNSAGFLEEFGGGGHSAAAGATIELPLEEARRVILEKVTATLTGN